MNEPYRSSEESAPAPTFSTTDPAEQAIVDAIVTLRSRFQVWAEYTPGVSGSALGAAALGVGQGVAKMTDALVRLRQQKLGGSL